MTASVEEVLAVMGEGQWTTGAVAARLGWLPEAGRRIMVLAHLAGRVRRCGEGQWEAFDVRGAILSHMQASPTTLFTPAHLAIELADLKLSHDEVAAHLTALSGGGALEVYACVGLEPDCTYTTWELGAAQP